MFLKAVVLAQSGRLGKNLTATCSIGGGPGGWPLGTNRSAGQSRLELLAGPGSRQYPTSRNAATATFRWWLEYSGGKMTDWGAHHIDIAQWGLGYSDSGPVEIEGTATFPDVFPDGF